MAGSMILTVTTGNVFARNEDTLFSALSALYFRSMDGFLVVAANLVSEQKMKWIFRIATRRRTYTPIELDTDAAFFTGSNSLLKVGTHRVLFTQQCQLLMQTECTCYFQRLFL